MRAMRLHWRPILAGLLVAASAVRVAEVVARARMDFSRAAYCWDEDRNVEAGEALFHGIPRKERRLSWSMPAYSLAGVLVCHSDSPEAALAWPTAALILCALLVLGIGALLFDVLVGAVGLALYAHLAAGPESFNDRWLFTLSVTLTAFLLVWRARDPSPAKTWLLASSIGLSMSILSPLCLLPPALALWELLGEKDRLPLRARLKECAILLLAPYLILLPWIAMNWQLGHGFVPLENGRADANVLAGALGLVETRTSAISLALARRAGLEEGRSALTWALAEMVRHPVRTLGAFAARLRYAVELQPLLLLSCLPLLARREAAPRRLGALLCYLLALQCLTTLETRYFTPLWPVAAAGAACLAGWGSPSTSGRGAWPRWLAGLALLPLAALTASAMSLALAYPRRAASEAPLDHDRMLARFPRDHWLWTERGFARLREGRFDEAIEDLSAAKDLSAEVDAELDLLMARSLRAAAGGPARASISAYVDAFRSWSSRQKFAAIAAMIERPRGSRDVPPPEASPPLASLKALDPRAPLYADMARSLVRMALAQNDRTLTVEAAYHLLDGRPEAAAPVVRMLERRDRTLALETVRRLIKSRSQAALAFDPGLVDLALFLSSPPERLEALQALRRPAGRAPPFHADNLRGLVGRSLGRGDKATALEAARLLGGAWPLELEPDLADPLLALLDARQSAQTFQALGGASRRATPLHAERLRELSGRALARGDRSAALETARLLGKRWPLELHPDAADALLSSPDLRAALAAAAPVDAPKLRALAGRALARGDRAAALEIARWTAANAPPDPQALLDLARLEADAGGLERARRALERAREQGAFERWPRQAAGILRDVGEPRLESIRLSLALDGSPANQAAASRLLTALGSYDEALRLADLLVRGEPEVAAHHNDRAVLLILLGRGQEGEAELERTLALDPQAGSAYATLASRRLAQGRSREALELCDKAFAQRALKAGPEVLRLLQDTCARAGRRAGS